MSTKLYNLTYLKNYRKQLRKNMTGAELVLWEVLKDKKLCGRKFRRQHSIGNYIADFYCSSEKLIIELDGQHHYTKEGIEKDIERDTHLELMEKKVLRFENKEVLNNLTVNDGDAEIRNNVNVTIDGLTLNGAGRNLEIRNNRGNCTYNNITTH